MNILALEVSTSSAKAFIYSTAEGIINSYSIPYSRSVSNVAFQDPVGVYRTVIDCARNLLESENYDIDIIGLASTWHSFLLLDKNREPIGKIQSWANTDAASTASKLRQNMGLNRWVYKKTGCPLHSIYPLSKWMHLVKERKVSPRDKVYISSKPEYIFEKLTGEIGVSKSVASGTGLLNIHKLMWDEEILNFAGIRKEQLAPLRRYDYTAPLQKSEAKKLGIRKDIPVIITGPDGALNQIGSGALEDGIMTLSVGTSGALRMISQKPVLPDEPSTWCYYTAEGKRLAGAATSGAGNCIEWFKSEIIRNSLNLDFLSQLAEKVDSRKAPIFLPFLYGERCPGWDDMRSGGFYGLKGYHSTGHLYHAVLEGILFNLYQSYKILVDVGELPEEIRISGGIKNSNFWLQMAANIFRRNIITSTVKDASTMGAIVIALKVRDVIDRLEDFKPERGKVISPEENKVEIYKDRFKEYMQLYQRRF